MVLYHVAKGSRAVVVITSIFNSELLCHRYLYMLYIISAPHRFEERVRKAKSKDILHCFLTKIMINTIYLLLFKNATQQPVQLPRRLKVVSKWLFNNNPCFFQVRGKVTL